MAHFHCFLVFKLECLQDSDLSVNLNEDRDGKPLMLPLGQPQHDSRLMQTHRRRQTLTEAEWRRCLAVVLLSLNGGAASAFLLDRRIVTVMFSGM